MSSHDLDHARVFVGTDRSQLLAVKVLEHSIRRHTSMKVTVHPMHNLVLPEPKDIRQGRRTGFSFTRFAIPELVGHSGRALYLDADMLVFRDFRELYGLPFNGAKVLIQESLPEKVEFENKRGAPSHRVKQSSVMLLDCDRLGWDVQKIISGLDDKYTYEELMQELCILQSEDIGNSIPFHWNSLEAYTPGVTGLIHYTDMNSQPWVSLDNRLGYLWFNEVRFMLDNGELERAEVEEEIKLGYFRPSLLREIDLGEQRGPTNAREVERLRTIDKAADYVPHKEVNEQAHRRRQAVRQYEAELRREGAALAKGAQLSFMSKLFSRR